MMIPRSYRSASSAARALLCVLALLLCTALTSFADGPSLTLPFDPNDGAVDFSADLLLARPKNVNPINGVPQTPNVPPILTLQKVNPPAGVNATIRYTVTIQSTNGSLVRRRQSKTNVVTINNLPPGSYTATYRVALVDPDERVIAKTKPSRPLKLSVSRLRPSGGKRP